MELDRTARLARFTNSGEPIIKIVFNNKQSFYADLTLIKAIPGNKFINDGESERYWICPLAVETIRKLQSNGFRIGSKLLEYLKPESTKIESNAIIQTEVVYITYGARLTIRGLPEDVKEWCIKENTFYNPKYYILKKLNRQVQGISKLITLAREVSTGGITLPRGFKRELLTKLREQRIQFSVHDCTICPASELYGIGRVALCGFQQRTVDQMLQHYYGVLQAPTGSGKTNIMLGLIAKLHTTILIITHTHRLFKQISERVQTELGVTPGQIIGSTLELRTVTVAMIQTLRNRDLRKTGIAQYFGAILVDEAHHSPAHTWAGILDHLPARYKFGFTATAWRKDKLEFLMWRLIGPKIATVTKAEAEAAGRIIWPIRKEVVTTYNFKMKSSSEWTTMLSNLILNEPRNQLIVKTVRAEMHSENKALILTDRIHHAEVLAKMLASYQPTLLTGAMDRDDQEQAMTCIRAGAHLTVATVGMLGEGVDVPGWDLLFLVSPFAGGPRTLQAIGRVTRPAPGKKRPLVVDFVDEQVDILLIAAGSRERLYRDAE